MREQLVIFCSSAGTTSEAPVWRRRASFKGANARPTTGNKRKGDGQDKRARAAENFERPHRDIDRAKWAQKRERPAHLHGIYQPTSGIGDDDEQDHMLKGPKWSLAQVCQPTWTTINRGRQKNMMQAARSPRWRPTAGNAPASRPSSAPKLATCSGSGFRSRACCD